MATLREQNTKLKGIVKKNQKPRCSIADPYEKFWPLLDPEKSIVLVNELESTISKENGKLKINWYALRNLPLDVRKCQIKDLSNKHKIISPNLKAQRSILKMGINEVGRSIERDQLACCLIAEDVANCVIAKHLLLMTAAKKIPTLIISDLRSITKRIIGFSSVTIGLKTDVLNNKGSSLHSLYQTIVQLSNKFKNPYLKQNIKKESTEVQNSIKLNFNIENYLLKKPREGRAFVPGGTSNIRTLDDLSFIPIDKMMVKEQKTYKQDDELVEISTSTNLFSVDTKPIEDIGEFVERKTKTYREPLRYYGLKMKKMKPNSDRRCREGENINKINK